MRRTLAWITISLLLAGLAPTMSLAAEENLPLIGDHNRISSMGVAGLDIDDDAEERARYDAFAPAVAANPQRDVMMMVWHGDNNAEQNIDGDSDVTNNVSLANDEYEIWGRQIDARNATGSGNISLLDSTFRISLMGDEAETESAERRRYQALNPDVAFNADERQFLVVWRADDDTGPLVDDEYEIWGRLYQDSERGFARANPVDDPFRITTIGDDNETDAAVRASHGAYEPRIAWDPTTGNYLLVYPSNDPDFGLADNEYEIFGQRLNADGETVGAPFRVSHMGPDGDPAYRAEKPAIAWNDVAGQFLVAWQGDDDTAPLIDDEFEIYARAVAPDGSMPSSQQRVSEMGPDGDADYNAFDPAIAVNASTGEYMVAWSGDDNTAPLVNDEFEIFSRTLDISGMPVGSTFRISSMGPDGNPDFDAEDPSIAWHKGAQHFMVSWRGDDNTAPMVEGEYQVFAQSVNPDGSLYQEHFRVSNNNLDGTDDAETDPAERIKREAHWPASINAGGSVYHFWSADGPELSDDEFEIFTRRTSWQATTILAEGIRHERTEVPAPITVEYVINNVGDQPAKNVYLRYGLSQEFDTSWTGCTADVAEEICEIGDLEPDESIEIVIELDTSDLQVGDHLGTILDIGIFSDTALMRAAVDVNDTPDDTSDDPLAGLQHQRFVSAVLKIGDGGSGALLPLIPVLLLLWGMAARRHD